MEDSTNNGVAIRTEGVCRFYGEGASAIRAVDGVTLEVRAGEFLALLGSSGSGKSTLLNLIAGLDRPTSGSITVHDRNLAQMTSQELASYRRHTIGMVFQSFNLIPTMTVAENVELPMRFAEVDRGERDSRVRDALSHVGLEARVTHRPSELSGGEQQRVALARALVNRPSLLLADEPTGNLDPPTAARVFDKLLSLVRQSGVAAVIATHNLELAARMDRTLRLADGLLVEEEVVVATVGSSGPARKSRPKPI